MKRAGDLQTGEKFETVHTGRSGVVERVRELVIGEDARGRAIRFHAPRVLMAGGGITHRTLHPDVLVNVNPFKEK